MSELASTWADRFEQWVGSHDLAEQARRRRQFQRFAATGFPGPADEAWHYTDLAAQADAGYQLAGADAVGAEGASTPIAALPGCALLVYRNGVLDRAASSAAAFDGLALAASAVAGSDDDGAQDDGGIDALNAAYASDGLVCTVAAGQRAVQPLQVVLQSEAGDTPLMSHQRHRIVLGAQAEATVLLQFVGHGCTRLATHVIEVTLAAGARLHLHRLSGETAGATLLTRLDARLDRDAQLHLSGIAVGGGLGRHRADVRLEGSGAELHATSLQVPASGAHVDDLVRVVHAAPHGTSRIVARGIVDAHAKAIFNGRVVVRPGAQKTDSEQRLANLLLSRKAEVNAKPDLEIHADDVKCAHGATVGQLDAVALAYLRSRGIPQAEARALLLRAFATETLERLGWPALQALIAEQLGLPAEALDLAFGDAE